MWRICGSFYDRVFSFGCQRLTLLRGKSQSKSNSSKTTGVTVRHRLKANCLVYLLSTLIVMGSLSFASAQKNQWDSRFIDESTFFNLSLNIQSMIENKTFPKEMLEQIDKQMSEFGLDSKDFKEVQINFGGELPEGKNFNRNGDELLSIKVVFLDDVDIEDLIEKSGFDIATAKHSGKDYYRASSENNPSIFAPEKDTVIFSIERRLKQIMEIKESEGKILDQIEAADGQAEAVLSFVYNEMTDQIMGEIQEGMGGAMPFNLQDIAAEAKHGQITFNFSDDKPMSGEIVAKNNKGAERLKRAVDAIVALGKTTLPTAKEQVKRMIDGDFGFGGGDEQFKKMMESQLEMLESTEEVLNGMETDVKGETLNISTKVEGGMKKIIESIGSSMFMAFRIQSEIEGEIIEEAIEIDCK